MSLGPSLGPHLLLAATALVWGGAFVAGRLLVADLDPITVAWLRFLVASAAFRLLGWLGRDLRRPAGAAPAPNAPSPAPGWAPYALLGLTGILAYNLFFFYGLTYATATESSLIIASSPIVAALLGVVFLRERLLPGRAVGIALSTAGVVVLVLGAAAGSPDPGVQGGRVPGALLMLGGVVSWAVYSVVGKTVLSHVSPWVATSRAAYWGTLFLTVLVVLRPDPTSVALARMDAPAWLGIGYLSLVCTVFGFVAWYRGVAAVGVAGSAAFLNLVPLFTLAMAAATLGERLAWIQGVGGLMVMGGVYLVGAMQAGSRSSVTVGSRSHLVNRRPGRLPRENSDQVLGGQRGHGCSRGDRGAADMR